MATSSPVVPAAVVASTEMNGNKSTRTQYPVLGYLDILSPTGETEKTYVISSTYVRIGRDTKSDVRLEGNGKISRHQCEIHMKTSNDLYRNCDAAIRSLSTKRTTFLTGKVVEVNIQAKLSNESEIRLVTQDLKWRYHNPQDPTGKAQAGSAPLIHIPHPRTNERTSATSSSAPSIPSIKPCPSSRKPASPGQSKLAIQPQPSPVGAGTSSVPGRTSLPARHSSKSPSSSKSQSRRRSADVDMRKAVLKKSFKMSVHEKKDRRSTSIFKDIPGAKPEDKIDEEEDKEEGGTNEDKNPGITNASSDLIRFSSPEPGVSYDLIDLDAAEETGQNGGTNTSGASTREIEMIEMMGTETARADPEEEKEEVQLEVVGENGQEENGDYSAYYSVSSDNSDNETHYTSFNEEKESTVCTEDGEEDIQEIEVQAENIEVEEAEETFSESKVNLNPDLSMDSSFDDERASVIVNLGSTINNNDSRNITDIGTTEPNDDTQVLEFSYMTENETSMLEDSEDQVVTATPADADEHDESVHEEEESMSDVETQGLAEEGSEELESEGEEANQLETQVLIEEDSEKVNAEDQSDDDLSQEDTETRALSEESSAGLDSEDQAEDESGEDNIETQTLTIENSEDANDDGQGEEDIETQTLTIENSEDANDDGQGEEDIETQTLTIENSEDANDDGQGEEDIETQTLTIDGSENANEDDQVEDELSEEEIETQNLTIGLESANDEDQDEDEPSQEDLDTQVFTEEYSEEVAGADQVTVEPNNDEDLSQLETQGFIGDDNDGQEANGIVSDVGEINGTGQVEIQFEELETQAVAVETFEEEIAIPKVHSTNGTEPEDDIIEHEIEMSIVDGPEEMDISISASSDEAEPEPEAGNTSQEEDSFNIDKIEAEMKKIFGDSRSSEESNEPYVDPNTSTHAVDGESLVEEVPIQDQVVRRSSRSSVNASLPTVTPIRTPNVRTRKTPSVSTPVVGAGTNATQDSAIETDKPTRRTSRRSSSSSSRSSGTPARTPRNIAKTSVNTPVIQEVYYEEELHAETEALEVEADHIETETPEDDPVEVEEVGIEAGVPAEASRLEFEAPEIETAEVEAPEVQNGVIVPDVEDVKADVGAVEPDVEAESPIAGTSALLFETPLADAQDQSMRRSSGRSIYRRTLGARPPVRTSSIRTPVIPQVPDDAVDADTEAIQAEDKGSPLPRTSRRSSSRGTPSLPRTPARVSRNITKTPSVSTPTPVIQETFKEELEDDTEEMEVDSSPDKSEVAIPTHQAEIIDEVIDVLIDELIDEPSDPSATVSEYDEDELHQDVLNGIDDEKQTISEEQANEVEIEADERPLTEAQDVVLQANAKIQTPRRISRRASSSTTQSLVQTPVRTRRGTIAKTPSVNTPVIKEAADQASDADVEIEADISSELKDVEVPTVEIQVKTKTPVLPEAPISDAADNELDQDVLNAVDESQSKDDEQDNETESDVPAKVEAPSTSIEADEVKGDIEELETGAKAQQLRKSGQRPSSSPALPKTGTPVRTRRTIAKTPGVGTPVIPEASDEALNTYAKVPPTRRSNRSSATTAALAIAGTPVRVTRKVAKTPSANTPVIKEALSETRNAEAEVETEGSNDDEHQAAVHEADKAAEPSAPLPDDSEDEIPEDPKDDVEDEGQSANEGPDNEAVDDQAKIDVPAPVETPSTSTAPRRTSRVPKSTYREENYFFDIPFKIQRAPSTPSSAKSSRAYKTIATSPISHLAPENTPAKSARTATKSPKSAKTPGRSAKSRGKPARLSVRSSAISRKSPGQSTRTPVKSKSPVKVARTLVKSTKSPIKAAKSPAKPVKSPAKKTTKASTKVAKSKGKKKVQAEDEDQDSDEVPAAGAKKRLSNEALIESCKTKRLSVSLERLNEANDQPTDTDLDQEAASPPKKAPKKAGRPKKAPAKPKAKTTTTKKRVSITLRRKTIGTQTSSKAKSTTPTPELIQLSSSEEDPISPKKNAKKTKGKQPAPKPARASMKRKRESSEEPEPSQTDPKTGNQGKKRRGGRADPEPEVPSIPVPAVAVAEPSVRGRGRPKAKQAKSKEVESEEEDEQTETPVVPETRKATRRAKPTVVEEEPEPSVPTPKLPKQGANAKAKVASPKRRGKKALPEPSTVPKAKRPRREPTPEVEDSLSTEVISSEEEEVIEEPAPKVKGRARAKPSRSKKAAAPESELLPAYESSEEEETVPEPPPKRRGRGKAGPSAKTVITVSEVKIPEPVSKLKAKAKRGKEQPTVDEDSVVEIDVEENVAGPSKPKGRRGKAAIPAPVPVVEDEPAPRGRGAEKTKPEDIPVQKASTRAKPNLPEPEVVPEPKGRRGKAKPAPVPPAVVDEDIQILKDLKPGRGGRRAAVEEAPKVSQTEAKKVKAPEPAKRALRSRR